MREYEKVEARAAQEALFTRRKWAGVWLLALVVVGITLWRANPAWLWQPGWWKLW